MSGTKLPRTRIEEIRLTRRFRSAEVARRAGMDPSTMHKLETGKSQLTRTWREPLARALMVPEEQLYAPIGAAIPFEPDIGVVVEDRPYEPDHAPPAIGQRLQAIMRYIALGPADLAQAIGAEEPQVVDWLEGRVKPPLALMNRLANRAGVTVSYIYFGDVSGLFPGIARLLEMGGFD